MSLPPPDGVTTTIEDGSSWEPAGWIRQSLRTLRCLVNLVGWAKAGDTGVIKDLGFREPQTWPITDDALDGAPQVLLVEGEEPWRLAWDPWVDLRRKVYRSPKTESDLIRAAWEVVFSWFSTWFRAHDRIVPILSKDNRLRLALGADSLLEEAMGEFYIQEVAGAYPKCKACGNPLYPPRRKYCCRSCWRRDRKRRERAEAGNPKLALMEKYMQRIRRSNFPEEKKEELKRKLARTYRSKASVEEFEEYADGLIPKKRPGRPPAR